MLNKGVKTPADLMILSSWKGIDIVNKPLIQLQYQIEKCRMLWNSAAEGLNLAWEIREDFHENIKI